MTQACRYLLLPGQLYAINLVMVQLGMLMTRKLMWWSWLHIPNIHQVSGQRGLFRPCSCIQTRESDPVRSERQPRKSGQIMYISTKNHACPQAQDNKHECVWELYVSRAWWTLWKLPPRGQENYRTRGSWTFHWRAFANVVVLMRFAEHGALY